MEQLARRVGQLNLVTKDVPRDDSCYFHAVADWLVELLGTLGAQELLNTQDVSAASVRNFLCNWAEANRELVIDDEGEATVQVLAVRTATSCLPFVSVRGM